MKSSLLRHIVCPSCRGDLSLHVFHGDKANQQDFEQGVLVCRACSLPYPVVEGIPRLLPNAMRRHRSFADSFSEELARLSCRTPDREAVSRFDRAHRLTARAFGYEWNTYATTSVDEDVLTFFYLTGVDPTLYHWLPAQDVFSYYPTAEEVARIDASMIRGKTVLEVGCGMGKYLKVASTHAAEVVGLDLSDALLRARRETSGADNVHLVQGDILTPPIRPASIDFVYSVGVLHHTPNCQEAFRRTAQLVKPGGRLAVWLYPEDPTPGPYAKWVHRQQDDILRPLTCRMPPPLLRLLCKGLGRLTFVRDHYAEVYRSSGSKLAYYVAMASGAVAVGRHRDPEIAAFLNFDWYSPQYRSYHTESDLQTWYREAGFREPTILPQRVSGTAEKEGP